MEKHPEEVMAMIKKALHMVSAFASEARIVLGQQKTSEKSNEIKAIPQLLDLLDIRGSIVTIDAMGCQKKIAKKIKEKEGDYILAVKGNQETLHEDIKLFFNDEDLIKMLIFIKKSIAAMVGFKHKSVC